MNSGFEPPLLATAARSGVNPTRLLLLQILLRSTDPYSAITHDADSSQSVTAWLPRAEAVLRTHAESGQPYQKPVEATCQDASKACLRLVAETAAHPELLEAANLLARVSPSGPTLPVDYLAAANALVVAAASVERLVGHLFARQWDRGDASDHVLTRVIGRELAALLVLQGRTGESLRETCESVAADPALDGRAALARLAPPARAHRAAFVIEGAKAFDNLESLLLPPVTRVDQFPLAARSWPSWGRATEKLDDFVEGNRGLARRRKSCVVAVEMMAADRDAAASVGRRWVTEMLDQYVAGHRLVDLRLRDEAITGEVDSRLATRASPVGPVVQVAFPLSKSWPASLRASMRTAHIARTTDSPMASAALAWASIEAMGVKPLEIPKLARAYALQAFRHQFIQMYRDISHAVSGEMETHLQELEGAAKKVTVLETSMSRFRVPAGAPVVGKHAAAVAVRAEARGRYWLALRDVDGPFQALRSYLGTTPKHFPDLNEWVDLLRPAGLGEPEVVSNARRALWATMQSLSPLAVVGVRDWRGRLREPRQATEWLEHRAAWFEATLRWMYANRNMSLHNGMHQMTGDRELALTASGVADLNLEMLGNWYSVSSRLGLGSSLSMKPADVIRQLSDRMRVVSSGLTRRPLDTLNVRELTGPTSDGWDR